MPKIDIPLVRQKDKEFCSEASAEMLLKYYGHKTPEGLQYALDFIGCKTMERMDKCLSLFDMKCEIKKDGSYEDIKENIEKGNPVMLRIIPEDGEELHTVVPIEVDESDITTNDPALPIPLTYTKNNFSKLWNKTNNLMLICKK